MQRQAVNGGQWFDVDAARYWDESTWWNGHNLVSKATGSQWEHQRLYRTAGGAWVLHSWSQWEGTPDRWEPITPEAAAAWLVEAERFDDVPDELRPLVDAAELT